jgi:tetratricopeptide (TPR) repeat protein
LADAVGQPARLDAAVIADAAAARARDTDDEAGEAVARVVAALYRHSTGAETTANLEALARAALPPLEQASDHAGLEQVWNALAWVANMRGRFDEMGKAFEHRLCHARLAGRWRPGLLSGVVWALVVGPRPASEALQRIDELLLEHPTPRSLLWRANLLAMLGRFDEAWQIALEASTQSREFSGTATAEQHLAAIASLVGDHDTAVQHLRRLCDELERQGVRSFLSSFAPMLGRELCTLGQYEEAERLARQGRELAAPDDVMTQMLWRQAQALVHAHHGERPEAERLAREAVEIAERTDSPNRQGDALCDLAEVLDAAGSPAEAAEALERALDRYQRKQNVAMVAQVQPRLQVLREGAPA